MNDIPLKQQFFGFIIAFTILIVIIELVRRRKLREEYSWVWILTGIMLFGFVLRYDILYRITRLIGATLPTSTLFFFGLIFVILLCLQYAVRISTFDGKIRALTQEIALLKFEINELGRIAVSPVDAPENRDEHPDNTSS